LNIDEYIKSGLVEMYVLGLTSDAERAEVEQLAAKYPELQSHIQAMQNAMEDYAKSYALPPREGLKGDVMKSIDDAETSSISDDAIQPTTSRGIPTWITGLAAAMLIGVGFFAFQLNSQNQEQVLQINQLEKDLAALKEDCQTSKATQQQMLALLKDVNTKHVHLLGTNNSPESVVVAYWNENKKKAYISVVAMPDVPADHDYQLWADIDGEMVDMGVVKLAENNLIEVPYMERAASLNITIEKEGGNDHPNVKQLMVSGKV